MAELSKLLSFMFREDRDEIIQHYNQLLDDADDEQALLEQFGSPTKLAVTISRSYDREVRKLAVNADSKAEATAPETFTPITPVKAEDEEPEQPDFDENCDEIADQILEMTSPEAAEEAPVVEKAPVEEEAPAVEEAPAEEAHPVVEEPTVAEEAPVEEEATAAEEAPVEEEATVVEEAPVEEEPTVVEEAEDDIGKTEERIRPFVLILYLIFAIPIGLALLGVLIAVTFSLLGASLCVGGVGIHVLTLAFSGMQLMADTLIVLGAGIAVLAVGLILVWFSIWLIIVSFRGLFRGIIGLGRKLCVKEVAVNG